jgi:hypothetical protein
MSAPQATTDTNDILSGLCQCLGADSERPRAWPEKSAGPIRDAVTAIAGAAINEASGWRPMLRV